MSPKIIIVRGIQIEIDHVHLEHVNNSGQLLLEKDSVDSNKDDIDHYRCYLRKTIFTSLQTCRHEKLLAITLLKADDWHVVSILRQTSDTMSIERDFIIDDKNRYPSHFQSGGESFIKWETILKIWNNNFLVHKDC